MYKKVYEEKAEEYQKLKKEVDELKKIEPSERSLNRNQGKLDYFKKRLEEKSTEINKLQARVSPVVMEKNSRKVYSRNIRKSVGEIDIKYSPSPYGLKTDFTDSTPRKQDVKVRKKTSFRKHSRSNTTDYSRNTKRNTSR